MVTDSRRPSYGTAGDGAREFELRGGGRHWLLLTARGFTSGDAGASRLRGQADSHRAGPAPSEGLEVVGDAEENVLDSTRALPRTGSRALCSRDRLARLSVFDGGGRERGRDYEDSLLDDPHQARIAWSPSCRRLHAPRRSFRWRVTRKITVARPSEPAVE